MNQHVREDQGALAPVLDMADKLVQDDVAFVQDDSDYPVDPLDAPGANAPKDEEDKG